MWKKNKKIKRKEKVPWQIMDGRALLLSPEESQAHELNETATWVWQILVDELTYEELLENFCSEYEVEQAEADQDLQELLDQLVEKKLIEES